MYLMGVKSSGIVERWDGKESLGLKDRDLWSIVKTLSCYHEIGYNYMKKEEINRAMGKAHMLARRQLSVREV